MSDTTATTMAPNVAPASAPAPANEAVINQNPTNSPVPIGGQAPALPDGAERPSRRDAIKAAFDRAEERSKTGVTKPAAKSVAKPSEARTGHNQPPEETEKFDLKKRPSDQPVLRGERGQFAPRGNGQDRPGVANAGQPGQPAQQPAQRLADNSPYRNAPPRMSEHARAHWATTPEPVRADIHRMNKEVGQAFQYYKQDYEAMKTLRPYAKMAQEHGTTLDKALSNYVGIEQKLRADPVAGLDTIVYNLGLIDPETNQRITLRDVAYHVLSQTPEQLQALQQRNAQTATVHQMGALHQRIAGLENANRQMAQQQHFTYNRSQVDVFAATHPRFDEISDLIEKEIKLGFDLESAYRRAELLRPAPHAAQTRTTSVQTRPADRSISGAPGAGSAREPTRRAQDFSRSPRGSVANAFKRYQNGSY